jgi:multicomponent Na+:H+ antiporter subunit E
MRLATSISSTVPLVYRGLLFALVWLVLVGIDPQSWIIGLPAVVGAALAAISLSRRQGGNPSVFGIIGFLPFFVWESVLGGVDVAHRVMRPTIKIEPGFRSYPLRLQGPGARVFFLDTISLLPGTLSAYMRDGVGQVHTLDLRDDNLDSSLADLEGRVAKLFGETWEDDRSD